MEQLRQRVVMNPRDTTARGELALKLEKLGFTEEALSHYREMEPLMPGSWQLFFNMAKTCQTLKRYPEAARAYEQTLQLNSANADAWNNLGLVYGELKEFPRAVTAFERAMEERGGHSLASFNLAVLFLNMGDKSAALRQFQTTAQKFPSMQPYISPYLKLLTD